MSKKILSLQNISLSIGNRDILQDISLDLEEANILTVIGPNGAGKSTLIRIILGLQKADSGTVWLRKKLSIGYVPQKLSINAQIPLSVRHFITLGGSFSDADLQQTLTDIEALHVIDQPVQSISGGEMQRILLARALLRNPELLVLDEPAQGVDVTGQAKLYQLIDQLVKSRGFGVLMVSHDLHLVMAKTNQVLCLNQHICCSGMPEDVSNHPEYKNLFGAGESENIAVYTHHHDHHHALDGHVCSQKDCGMRKHG